MRIATAAKATANQPQQRAADSEGAGLLTTTLVRWGAFIKNPITGWGGLGGVLLWAAFPPLGLSLAVWPGMAIWLWLVRRQPSLSRQDYRRWYLVGLVYWLLVVHWVRLPHWSAWFGWLALSLYLAAYIPAFVGLLSVASRLRVPAVAAAPVIWTGLEWLRGHLFTGLSISLLGHTLVNVEPLIQIADIFGAYGVSFLVVLVAACLAEVADAWWTRQATAARPFQLIERSPRRAIGIALLALGFTWTYGTWRLGQVNRLAANRSESPVRVALVQGSVDTTFSEEDTTESTFAEYAALTRDACKSSHNPPSSPLDLIIWPESMFAFPWVEVSAPVTPPPDAEGDVETFAGQAIEWRNWTVAQTRDYCGRIGIPMLVGTGKLCFGPHPVKRFNSALYFDRHGELVHCYDKMRPVLFGEYVPLGNVFPWLYRLTPMPGGLDRGTAPLALECAGLQFCPCICFENTIPHWLRQQYRQLQAEGTEPDVLVTLTNDGWFWGSSLLDMHLACGIFRAVELRRPMLIAANTGFSAWIDAAGQVIERGPRRDQGVVIAKLFKSGESKSVYLLMGDLPAILCASFCGCLLLVAVDRGRCSRFLKRLSTRG